MALAFFVLAIASLLVLHVLLFAVVAPFLREQGVRLPFVKGPFWLKDALEVYRDCLRIEEKPAGWYMAMKALEYAFYLFLLLFVWTCFQDCSRRSRETHDIIRKDIQERRIDDYVD